MAYAKITQTNEEFDDEAELMVGVTNYLWGCGLPPTANINAIENCTDNNTVPLAPFATVEYL